MKPCPMNAETTCRTWRDFKGYGFVRNPDAGEPDIFCHAKLLPDRFGIGQRLRKGERVKVKYVQHGDRCTATAISFPDAAP